MNYLQEILGYLLGLYVPSINSTSVILSLNKENIDRLCRLRIMKVWSMLESTSVIIGYYGIRSNKTALGEGIEKYSEIDINCILGIIGSMAFMLAIYALLIGLYIYIEKGLTYKLVGMGYLITYILTSIQWNLLVLLYLIIVSVLSVILLKRTPPAIRSISFSMITLIK